MIGILNFTTVVLLLAGCMMFVGTSKTSRLWTWLLLTLAMLINGISCVISQNFIGLSMSIIAFVLDFRLFRKALKEYNKERREKNKKDNFFKELEEYCFERKTGLRKVWY